MSLFFLMLGKTLPLYFNVLIGYLASKKLGVERESIASLLIYVIGPVVVFFATVSVKIDLALALFPLLLFILSSVLAFVVYYSCRKYWQDGTGNILAFTAGTGNTGFFGIPLAMVLLPSHLADIYVFAVLSSLLYESSTGFYVTAKGKLTTTDVLRKILRLPPLYAFLLALVFNLFGLEIPRVLFEYGSYFKGAYGILGMMILGMGLSGLKDGGHLDWKFINLSLVFKFILWPLLMFGLIALDHYILHYLNPEFYIVAIIFALVPMAGNTVTLAVLLKTKPEKASIAVFISTVIAILYIPLMLVLTGLLPFPVPLDFNKL
ncbi:AEC family transporter [Leptospira brenneri]|uniref:AEC family transporter n=1 Tax=Leptospira brenneri TaxID=2023182 RepID=A0A2M9Y0R4_9LEPT|nr:transporter [Leptospira brenneri]TGK97119.1 AEC family transporter [Leptospira brenneri]